MAGSRFKKTPRCFRRRRRARDSAARAPSPRARPRRRPRFLRPELRGRARGVLGGGLDVYQDALLDAAAVAAWPASARRQRAPRRRPPPDGRSLASAGEPSAGGPDEFGPWGRAQRGDGKRASVGPPTYRARFHAEVVADAAAAAAALQPLPLDLRSEAAQETDDAERENAEAAMRNARPPVELRGEDDFQVYADADDETAAAPKVR